MTKIVVTGGAGFLGSHLCDELIKRGDEVICIDNLITGNINNIAHLQGNPHFKFLEYDVINKIPQDLEFEQIYHLASPASPNKNYPKSYHALPFETMQVNTVGTWNLAEAVLQKGLLAGRQGAKFLFASTSEVYGDPKEHPQLESYNGNVSTIGPRAVYDEAKRFGETITSSFVRAKGLDAKIVRIFNTYGPGMALDDGRSIVEFVKACLEERPIPVFGTGAQTRSFCFVSDMIEGLILAMDKGTSGEVYNLGNPEELKIIELAEKIKELTNSLSEIKLIDELPEDDPQRRKPDISKAKKELNWEPQVSLDEGLSLFIEYVKTHLLT